MAALVVPGEVHRRKIGANAFVQNALQVSLDIRILYIRLGPVKERRRRKLFRISNHEITCLARAMAPMASQTGI